jgi:diguanylate cyclase (GGDEF)-like protein
MILRTIAIALKGFMRRPGDLAARYGGEEFVLLLPQVDAQAASHIAGDIRATVEQMQLAHPASPVSPYVTISLGGMTTQPYDGQVDPQFFRDADAALYAAKAQGRNRVVWQTTAG